MFRKGFKMKKIATILSIILITISCSKKESDDITIVTTTSFVTDTVKMVAGNKVEISGLIDFGQDPHTYDPSPRDIARVERADIIFVNGFDLEEGLMTILKNVNRDKIVELSQDIIPIESEDHDEHDEHDEHHHEVDPHTWMSPLNVIIWVENVTEALIRISPENSEYFLANSNSYINELNNLHNGILEKVSVIDIDNRVLVTDHASFTYFARDYQFSISGTIIPGFSSNSDTSAKSIVDLINIGETAGSDIVKLSDNIRSETGSIVKIIPLKTGSLDPPGTGADTYIKYMQYNVHRIVSGISE
jgi:ABC-type Zn uptake system ZnuABC Zn-binding protein ZnuA